MPMRNNEMLYNVFAYHKNHIEHYGTLGQKWGVRHWQNSDGTFNAEGKLRYFGTPKNRNTNGTVFISGSSKTQFDNSPYYREKLPDQIQEQIRKYMNQGKTILVGDAPGIDRQVQDFLKENNYKDVEVYSPGKEVRYNANPEWKTNLIDVPEAPQGSGEWLAGKDKAMSDRADEGLAIVLDDGSQATRNNISRLNEQDKNCDVFQLNKDGKDGWTKHGDFDENTLKKLKSEGYARDSYENESETDNGYLDNVANCMQEDFSYDDTNHKLQTPTQTFKYKTGNSHDQTLFEKELFEQAGLKPKAVFLMEVDPNTGESGVTHSFVYFEDPNTKRITKFENAWKDRAGVESFSSFNQMKDYMNWEHKNKNGFGNSQTYPDLVWGEFNGAPGDDLQDIITKSLSSKIGTDSFFKDLGLGKKVLSSLVKTKDKAKETAKEIYSNGKTKFLSKYGRNN